VVLLGAGGAWAVTRGVDFSGPGGGGLSSDRFRGAAGIVIPADEAPDYWWTRVVADDEAVGIGADYLPGVDPSQKFRRVLVPTDLLFGPDSSTLSPNYSTALDQVASTIVNPNLDVVVACHSSADGPVRERAPLSLRRANTLADALENRLGRQPASIGRVGKGDSVPLPNVDQSTPTGRALHRRCEIFVEIDS
jgi:OOP family OmpA-OmpF porin